MRLEPPRVSIASVFRVRSLQEIAKKRETRNVTRDLFWQDASSLAAIHLNQSKTRLGKCIISPISLLFVLIPE
jgi:hypothetical protein